MCRLGMTKSKQVQSIFDIDKLKAMGLEVIAEDILII